MSRRNSTFNLVPLAHYCKETGTPYATGYSALMRGDLPGENVYGRWWVTAEALRSAKRPTTTNQPASVLVDLPPAA